ncbi:flagellar hook-length control protein FliK [Jeotgalibacillus proteolyticus]|nr:flagellar hook-length control protein FliK [Jeotgalibacillus proteolyticus]
MKLMVNNLLPLTSKDQTKSMANELGSPRDKDHFGFTLEQLLMTRSSEKNDKLPLLADEEESAEAMLTETLSLLQANNTQFADKHSEQNTEESLNTMIKAAAEEVALTSFAAQVIVQDELEERPDQKLLPFLVDTAEKLADKPAAAILSREMASLLKQLKGIVEAAKSSDGPSSSSPLIKELSETLGKIEAKLLAVQHELTKERSETQNLLPKQRYFLSVQELSTTITLKGSSTQSAAGKNEPVASQEPALLQLTNFTRGSELLSSAPKSSQSLIDQFSQIMNQSKFGRKNGAEKLLIKLQPEHLGALRIELLQKDGILTARVMTTTAAAKEMLEGHLQQLRSSLAAQNLEVEKIDIRHEQQESGHFEKQKEQFSENSSEHNQGKQPEIENEETDDAPDFYQIFLNIEV